MDDLVTYFITWTTYGTWLPGDARGWRKASRGNQHPQPRLEAWCRNRLSERPVTLTESQQLKVEAVCREHARIRGSVLHAVSARSNHVHLAVTADKEPDVVRDQFKANATRVLREGPDAISNDKVWTRGGDCEIVDGEEELERVVLYITEAQDRMDRGK
jgi:REP element-mobilizing transposase RayT